MTDMTFDQRFQKAFDGGLADIKFFVRRDASVTSDALMSDALAFQEAIDAGNVKEVDGVDQPYLVGSGFYTSTIFYKEA